MVVFFGAVISVDPLRKSELGGLRHRDVAAIDCVTFAHLKDEDQNLLVHSNDCLEHATPSLPFIIQFTDSNFCHSADACAG